MEHQTASYDVAILGSGIAGGILGSILARNGLRVIILEEGVHPRFAVGESIVPEASFRMRLLAERYSVPELGNFSNFFRLRDHVSANSGVKRAFSFAYHHEGKAQDAAELSQFQAPGPPVGPDYHLFRQDVDAYLMTVAMRYGADVRQQAKVTKIELSSTGATLQLEKGGVVKAGYLVDGTGMRSVVADTLGLREAPTRFKTRSRCIFTHMIGVKPYDEVSPSRKEHGLPTPFHQSTLHHVFDGGWFWIIPFDNHREATNPLCSVGLTLDIDKYPGGGLPAEEEFMSFVRRFPSVAAQFEGARSARPWVSSGRLQFSSSKVIGERYAMLPHAAGFIDALFSSGLSMTIGAVGLLSDRLLQAFKDGDFSTERFARVEEYTQESLDHYDRLVANSFTSFQDFSLWNAWHRLWMMGVFIGGLSQLQSYMRYLASGDRALLKLTESAPYNGILGSRHPENRALFDEACAVMDQLRAGALTAPAAAEAVFAVLAKQTVVPKYFDLHVPERRMPSRFTLMGNLKMYFWYKRHASKEYQEQFVNWNLWNMHQYTTKLIEDQMGAVGKLRRFFRDIVTTTNDDWRELPACTPCTPPALPAGAREATASTPPPLPAGAERQDMIERSSKRSGDGGASAPAVRALWERLLPAIGIVTLFVAWDVAVRVTHTTILPGPIASLAGLLGMLRDGVIVKYVVASLFRVTWGYLAAVVLAVPAGLCLGWFRRAELSVNPLLQMLRPISPLAWIPIAILLFGVGDLSAVFIIFLGSFFPLVVAAMNAVGNVSTTHLHVGRNFGMGNFQLLRHIVFPAVLPQLIVGMRVSLGVAWLVVVAAEMIAVNSGLGFLIIEARNAGNRYDLVLGGIVVIGAIGVVLDLMMRRLERTKLLAWSYAANGNRQDAR